MTALKQSELDAVALYYWNPGIGDASWLQRDVEIHAALQKYSNCGACMLHVLPCGPPCGGYFYRLDILLHREPILAEMAKLKLEQSDRARKAFIGK